MKTKSLKILFILGLFVLLLTLGTTISNASYSANSPKVKSGENITITVSSSTAVDAYNLSLQTYTGLTFKNCSKSDSSAMININGSNIGYMNASGNTKTLGTYTFTAPEVAETKKYTVKFLVDQSTTVTSTVTVEPKSSASQTPSQNPDTVPTQPTQEEPTKPAESTQKGELTSLKVNGSKASINGSITVEGKSSVSISAITNTAEHCVVTDAYGTKYTIYSGNSKDIKLKNGTQKISIKLKSGQEYSLTISNKEKIEETKPNVIDKVDEKKEEEDQQEKIALKSLKIENCTLTPEFSAEVYSYKIELSEEQIDIAKLDIKAVANKEDAKIEIIGNENLQLGVNTITIIVKSANEEETVTYQIEVVKKEKQEEAMLTSADIQIQEQNQEKQPWGWGPKQKVLITILTSIIAVFGIVYAVIEYRYSKNNEGEFEIPYSDIGFLGADFKQSETDEEKKEKKPKEEEKITSSILNGIEPEPTDSFEETKPRSKNRGKHF